MTQEEIDKKISYYENEIWRHREDIRLCENLINIFRQEARKLDDPHVLIPKDYETIDEWLKYVPFPKVARKSHTFKNYLAAFDVQLCCNTYQECYHIKRLQNDTCARSGDEKRKQNEEI